MVQHSSVDIVRIAVPAQERMSKVVRLATTAAAGRVGLNIDQADDLSTAVDELFHVFLARQQTGEQQNFCINFDIMKDRLEVMAEGCGGFAEDSQNVGRYSHFLLESLSDGLEERPNPSGGYDVVIVKRASKI